VPVLGEVVGQMASRAFAQDDLFAGAFGHDGGIFLRGSGQRYEEKEKERAHLY
jgi:hypothetical protein